ncbi:MAG: sulfurtransferase [Actinobacteria bacterium]|nr:sulfurtransferase [Actinomycetota bacterium]
MPSKEELIAHFSSRLAFETDASDVRGAIEASAAFVLVDVRGQSSWDQGRAAAAIHMPHSEITERAPKEIPLDTPVVVYCWGPGCNGAHKGAVNFAQLGYQVKEMIGGFEYWAREGYPVVTDAGPVIRDKDPLTAPANSITCDC